MRRQSTLLWIYVNMVSNLQIPPSHAAFLEACMSYSLMQGVPPLALFLVGEDHFLSGPGRGLVGMASGAPIRAAAASAATAQQSFSGAEEGDGNPAQASATFGENMPAAVGAGEAPSAARAGQTQWRVGEVVSVPLAGGMPRAAAEAGEGPGAGGIITALVAGGVQPATADVAVWAEGSLQPASGAGDMAPTLRSGDVDMAQASQAGGAEAVAGAGGTLSEAGAMEAVQAVQVAAGDASPAGSSSGTRANRLEGSVLQTLHTVANDPQLSPSDRVMVISSYMKAIKLMFNIEYEE